MLNLIIINGIRQQLLVLILLLILNLRMFIVNLLDDVFHFSVTATLFLFHVGTGFLLIYFVNVFVDIVFRLEKLRNSDGCFGDYKCR